MRDNHQLSILLPAALVGCGLAAGIGQVLVFRELVVSCQGNEVSMAIMLAAWLLWGALVAGTLLVPVWGVTTTCWLTAALAMVASVLVLPTGDASG